MAKMMTVYVAFDLIKKGELKLDQQIEVRPETWKKWHSQGSTMFLAVGEKPTVADLLKGIVTLSGNDACVVLAEGIAGTEEAFVNLMNQQAQRIEWGSEGPSEYSGSLDVSPAGEDSQDSSQVEVRLHTTRAADGDPEVQDGITETLDNIKRQTETSRA